MYKFLAILSLVLLNDVSFASQFKCELDGSHIIVFLVGPEEIRPIPTANRFEQNRSKALEIKKLCSQKIARLSCNESSELIQEGKLLNKFNSQLECWIVLANTALQTETK